MSNVTSICLNMIVKNEGCIIIDTLSKLISKIKFDSFAICDTGSSDNTVELIETFFKNKFINGKIYNHEWKDFGYNRSLALKCAENSGSDYIFIFDADDEIIGEVDFSNLTLDGYMLKFGNTSSSYERMCLVKNNKSWCYRGVLHEYIYSSIISPKGSIMGNYYIVSGRTSSRNSDPDKYLKDAKILEKGYQESLELKDGLHHRYAYYCANSYFDACEKELAKEWYLTTLKCEGWYDERYNSCLKLFEITKDYYYLVESFYHNPRRVEGIYLLINHYTCEAKYNIAWNYYKFIQDYYENTPDELSTKLFANIQDYTFNLPYYMIIVCEKTKNYLTGKLMYQIIFEKMCNPGQWWIDNLIFNFQFFINNASDLFEKMKIYLKFLETKGIKLNKKIIRSFEKYGFYYFTQKNAILFYTGFAKECWNMTYSETRALGGSERAVISLAKEFSKHWDIVISGDVIEETIKSSTGTITFINRFNLKDQSYKTIIVSRYVSFFTLFPNFNCETLILMAHDEQFLNNLAGCTKTPGQIINENLSFITHCVCLTEWQKNEYIKLYPQLKSKIKIINNGIDKGGVIFSKIKNTFIYTSGSIRGLERLLELWPEILLHLPDAKLFISSYEDFPKDDFDRSLNINQTGIKHLGKLNQKDLYNLMKKCEYWLYPCCFNETSCITAMEMMNHGVICLYYPRAGLTDTMNGNGVQIFYGTEIETLLKVNKKNLINLGKNYTKTCLWENRAKEWLTVIKTVVFYASPNFAPELLTEYIASLGVVYTTDLNILENFDEIVFVHEVFDESVFKLGKPVSYLNTEPLNIKCRLNYVKAVQRYNFKNCYDYSLSNIKIMNDNRILNTKHLEYGFNQSEVDKLKEIKSQAVEIYDFGIICSSCVWTTRVDNLTPPRRQKLVKYLLSHGFSVNIITGFDEQRDREIAKCKSLLNIHGQFIEEPSNIFEHIRCNRLLYAGYHILSETCENLDPDFMDKYKEYLTFKSYNDFFKMTKLV